MCKSDQKVNEDGSCEDCEDDEKVSDDLKSCKSIK